MSTGSWPIKIKIEIRATSGKVTRKANPTELEFLPGSIREGNNLALQGGFQKKHGKTLEKLFPSTVGILDTLF